MEGSERRSEGGTCMDSRKGAEQEISLLNHDVSQNGRLSVLDFLISRQLMERSSPGPHCALLSGPPRCGKTSLLLQLAYNVASEAPHTVVFICKPRNFDNDYVYLAQDVDTSSEILDRIQIKYVYDDEELRKYFAAFHMHISLPTTVIVDDFIDFFQGWDGRQSGQPRSSRELAFVKTLCLAHNAITYASEYYRGTMLCRLILSDSHHGDGPRLSYIFKRWVHQTFVIKAIHDLAAFTLALHDERGHESENVVAKYDLSQKYLRFDGWDVLHTNH